MSKKIFYLFLTSVIIILGSGSSSYAFLCGSYFSNYEKVKTDSDRLKELRGLVPFHRTSKDLTKDEIGRIRNKIAEIRRMENKFRNSYNPLFRNQSTEFLSDLRLVFESQEADLRSKMLLIVNQLRRFIDNKSVLRFRDLDIFTTSDRLAKSWGIKFLDKPEAVYFNLSFFVTSRLPSGEYLDGYVYSEADSEELNASVFIMEDFSEENKDDLYPGSNIQIPRISKDQIFPGLPLDTELMGFLIKHGNTRGRIKLATIDHVRQRKIMLGKSQVLYKSQERVPIFSTRWSRSKNIFLDVLNPDGTTNYDLFNTSYYFESADHLIVPTLPVVWLQDRRSFFNLSKTDEELRTGVVIQDSNSADFSVAPTPFEFLVAFTEIYNPKVAIKK